MSTCLTCFNFSIFLHQKSSIDLFIYFFVITKIAISREHFYTLLINNLGFYKVNFHKKISSQLICQCHQRTFHILINYHVFKRLFYFYQAKIYLEFIVKRKYNTIFNQFVQRKILIEFC